MYVQTTNNINFQLKLLDYRDKIFKELICPNSKSHGNLVKFTYAFSVKLKYSTLVFALTRSVITLNFCDIYWKSILTANTFPA